MVAGGHDIGAGIDGLEKDVFGDAEAAGGVLAVDDDEIEFQVARSGRAVVPRPPSAGLADHVTQKQKSHDYLIGILARRCATRFRSGCVQRHIMRLAGTDATSWQSNAMPISLGFMAFPAQTRRWRGRNSRRRSRSGGRVVEGRKRHQHDVRIEHRGILGRPDGAETRVDDRRTGHEFAKDDGRLVEDGRKAEPRAALAQRAISGRISTSERIGQKPETIWPGSIAMLSRAVSAISSAASTRQNGSSASRRPSASRRRCFFRSFKDVMRRR